MELPQPDKSHIEFAVRRDFEKLQNQFQNIYASDISLQDKAFGALLRFLAEHHDDKFVSDAALSRENPNDFTPDHAEFISMINAALTHALMRSQTTTDEGTIGQLRTFFNVMEELKLSPPDIGVERISEAEKPLYTPDDPSIPTFKNE